MNNSYLARAKKMIPDPQILSVVAAKRPSSWRWAAGRWLNAIQENYLDWALLEIAEGLLSYEFGTPGETPSGLPALEPEASGKDAAAAAEESAPEPEA